jgi:transcriptional regulator with XRE-family HTH domain
VSRGAYYIHGKAWTRLYALREAVGFTQAEAAAVMGCSERTYRQREKLPQFAVTPAILAAFTAEMDDWRWRRVEAAGFVRILPKPASPAIAPKPEAAGCSL